MTTTYHGVAVTEDYRWLEDASSPETQAWTTAQHDRTMRYLRSLPGYDEIHRRARAILEAGATSYGSPRKAGDVYLALEQQPPKQQPFIVALDDLTDAASERTVVDPNELDRSGATTIDWFVPSPDGSVVAVSLSTHGTEDGTLRLFDVGNGTPLDLEIPHVNSGPAGGSLAWRGDGRAFWFTHHPLPGERDGVDELGFYQEIWLHDLDAARSTPDLREAFAEDRIVESFLDGDVHGAWVLDRAAKGDGGEWQVFLRSQADGQWWLVADLDDRVVDAVFGGDALFLLSRKDAPRGQILKLPLTAGATIADAQVVVPTSDVTIERLAATDSHVWVVDIDGGPSGLRGFTHAGEAVPAVDVPAVAAIDDIVALGADAVAYPVETFVAPRTWWVVRDEVPRPSATALDTTTPLDLSGYEVRRVSATSADGTRVPISLIAREGVLDAGPTPALLTAYGGYGISIKPWFQPGNLLWLEQGTVLAVANIRGGGEYGDEWHQAGRLTTKQNCFDDFTACARSLVDTGVTTVDRLVIMGGSNGGLLMGAVLTQHPDIATAVIAEVPVMDSLRVELHPNGVFNVTEFGSVEDPEQFRALYAYSPYHRVVDGTAYPAVLLTGGEFDPRVDASHAKKMAARLQAATSSDAPILLRIESGGHGIGQALDQEVDLLADLNAFAFTQAGVDRQLP